MRSVLVSAMVLLFCRWTLAVPPEASCSGVLRDNSGAPIAGVTVILSDTSGKTAFTARTKDSGEFAFSAVTPSTYKVLVITQQGMYQAAESLVVTEGATLKTNLQLSVADASL